jgi:hypothetical protein
MQIPLARSAAALACSPPGAGGVVGVARVLRHESRRLLALSALLMDRARSNGESRDEASLP